MPLNLCQFIGNVGQPPDKKYLPDGTCVVNFSLACGERWKDKTSGDIKEKTEWVRAVCFGKRAEVIAEYVTKGQQIYISGKLRSRSYDKDGDTRYITEIVIEDFQFTGNKAGSGTGEDKAQQQAEAYTKNAPADFDGDIPF